MKTKILPFALIIAAVAGCATSPDSEYKRRYNATLTTPPSSTDENRDSQLLELYADVPDFVANRTKPPDTNPKTQVNPKLIKQVTPIFPPHAIAEGTVLLAFIVDSEGNVRLPRVIESSDHIFEEYAISAVLQWQFEPATVDGRRVNCMMQVPILFKK